MSDIIKGNGVFIFTMSAAALSPSDSTTYYFGGGRISPTTTATDHNINMGIKFTIIGAVISVSQNSAAGTTENSTLKLRNVTQASSSTIGTFKTNATSTTVVSQTFTGLNISVAEGDFIAVEFATPAWASNPTGMITTIQFICLAGL